MMQARRLAIVVATVGGLGCSSLAPGTWGSIVGLAIGVLAAKTINGVLALVVLLTAFIACAFICAGAERVLKQHDPPSIIIDEVWGMCAVVVTVPMVSASIILLIIAFLLFRLFDIAKPPPLKLLEKFPSGFGIMADDLGAAIYTSGALLFLQWLSGHMAR